MGHPASDLYNIQSIPGAGRGVIASRSIAEGTPILQTQRPTAHVLFRQYRKEACAQCFYYNLGRTLPVRDSFADKVFCSSACQGPWREETGEVALDAWRKLYEFVTSKSNAITNGHSLPALCEKPDAQEINDAWSKAAKLSEEVRRSVDSLSRKQKHKSLVPTHAVDPDILGFFLAGAISHLLLPETWQDIRTLAMDPKPYRSPIDLQAHCNSFVQLSSLQLPNALLSNLTTEMCQTLVSAASHNAFGIHSGSDDGEEYLGYAVCPEASYFNHSCAPNIAKKRVDATWRFVAAKGIAEGEECCITYLGGDERELTVVARRARLRTTWGFECMCRRCVEESREEDKQHTSHSAADS